MIKIKGFVSKVWSISGSKVITIPKKVIRELKIKDGDYVKVLIDKVRIIEQSPSDTIVSHKE